MDLVHMMKLSQALLRRTAAPRNIRRISFSAGGTKRFDIGKRHEPCRATNRFLSHTGGGGTAQDLAALVALLDRDILRADFHGHDAEIEIELFRSDEREEFAFTAFRTLIHIQDLS